MLAAAGPWVTATYHLFYEFPGFGIDLDQLPGGAAWRAKVDAIAPRVRHLRLHESHFGYVDERDRDLVTAETVAAFTWTGSAAQLHERFAQYAAQGATEIFYEPTGPDPVREMTAFARAMGL